MKKCRVTFEYDEQDALAVANRYGWDKPASHEQMREHFESYGNSAMVDLVYEMKHGKAFGSEMPAPNYS